MSIKDAFEVLIKIFHGDRAELVKDAPHCDPIVDVRVASILGHHQQPVRLLAIFAQIRRVVMAIAQDEADFGRNFAQQSGSRLIVSNSGRGQDKSLGKSDRCNDRDEMQFPAVDESMPTGFGPVRLGINGGMRHLALFTMLVMPNAPTSLQGGTYR